LNVVETAATDPLGSFLGSIGHYASAWLINVTIVVLLTRQMAGQLALQGAASRYLHRRAAEWFVPCWHQGRPILPIGA